MRTTLDIEDPVLDAVKEIARREGRSAGAVASDLIRRALTQPSFLGVREPPTRYGFRPFAAIAGGEVTNEQVNRLRDEQGV
jgi:hypothetical protein